ncbi:MAG: ribosome small subunit-dependent GTPase A [Burkholderiales bacterium]|nr:ribosome small subunit-dependent GTPase A [Burkholderiales bacterium]
MLHIDLDRLQRVGLTPALADRARACAEGGEQRLDLLRVCSVHRETVQLHDGLGEGAARQVPRLARQLLEGGTMLAVGDWVLASRDASGARWVQQRVPPLSHIVRRDGDGSRHPVVSNVDWALLVMGLDDDFNLRRLERYLTLVYASGVAPIVVLTKADIAAADPERRDERLAALGKRLPGAVPTLTVDATDPASAGRFAHVACGGQTLVLLGSSGAGKSTLTNTLIGNAVQDTGAVREHDSRGMHTTTARSLHLLPGGACVIDTPGLRTLRPDVDEATLAASFGDVESLAGQCRFRDCTHGDEPGCAVREGVDPDRLRNFHKLLRETRRDSLTWVERRQQLSAWKSRGKDTRMRMKMKRGDG